MPSPPNPAGYSRTPLVRKLGVPADSRIVVQRAPWSYATRVVPLPEGTTIASRMASGTRFVHAFCSSPAELTQSLTAVAPKLADTGMLWISWPKQRKGVESALTETIVRERGLAAGLVDVKVCAVDEVWSGLKFVRRVADRGRTGGRSRSG